MKESITPEERLQLLGLLTLARKYAKQVEECDKQMSDVVGATDWGNHLSDAIYDDSDLDEVLNVMGIEVQSESSDS